MSALNWLFGMIGIAALVIGLVAGVAYSAGNDYRNQTDTFGNTHSQMENQTVGVVQSATSGSADISSAMLIFAAAMILMVSILGMYALTRQPKW